jgi:hypothetical protein
MPFSVAQAKEGDFQITLCLLVIWRFSKYFVKELFSFYLVATSSLTF